MAILKKISIIYFFIWILIPKDALLFIASFPAHYVHHLEDHGKISIIGFFEEHIVGAEKHRSGEEGQEQKFPCDHHHTENCSYSMHNVKILPVDDTCFFLALKEIEYVIPIQVHYPNGPLFSIWQPPKKSNYSLLG